MTIAVLSDLHVTEPWLSLGRLGRIVARANAIGADLILLPGDFIADRKMPGKPVPIGPIAQTLAQLRAPLGVHAVLGNHDWFDCLEARANRFATTSVERGLRDAGIGLLRNGALKLVHGQAPFWLVGLDSQRPVQKRPRIRYHDPDRAFGGVTDDAPAILVAHEPDYFAEGDGRAFLQISGHTHGGQINLFGWRPYVPSRFGARYAWGHHRDAGRHLVVSGGIGCSGLPLRLLQPPEITLVTVAGTD
jgi:predicted MPP superfamily phosphohydrolase